MLSNTLMLLSAPSMSLIFHLAVLFLLLISFLMSWDRWRRAKLPAGAIRDATEAKTQTIALGLILVLYLLPALVRLFVPAGDLSQGTWALAMERTADLAGLGLLVWAFVIVPRLEPGRGWQAAGLILLLVISALYLAAAVSYPAGAAALLDYNVFGPSLLWAGWQLIICLAALILLLLPKRTERSLSDANSNNLLIAVFASLLAVYGLHLLSALGTLWPYPAPNNLPIWVRWGQVFAYALLVFAIYHQTIASLENRPSREQFVAPPLWPTIDTEVPVDLSPVSENINASLDLLEIVLVASQGAAEALKADQAAVALLEEDQAGQMRLMGIYNPQGKRIEGVTIFAVEDFPTIDYALEQSLQMLISSDTKEAGRLLSLMGCNHSGPVLVQPLRRNEKALGALIAANGTTGRSFSEKEEELLQKIGQQTAGAIQNARSYQALENKVQQLTKTLRKQEVEAQQHRSAVEVDLKKSREEVALLAQRLYEQETNAKNSWQVLENAARTRVLSLQNAVKRSREERESLQQRVRELERKTTSEADGLTELEDLTCGVIIGDSEGLVSRVNSAASELLRIDPETIVGQTLIELLADEAWRRAVNELSIKPHDMVVTTVEVGNRVLRATLSPMAAARSGKQEQGSVAILYDITSDAENQQARDQFVASLSQELRTPMTSVVGYTDLLLGESVGLLGDMQRKFLQRIKANIERLNSLLNDLISVTVIDADQLELHYSSINVSDLVEETIIGIRAQLEDKEITLELNVDEQLPPIEADADCVRQILANLLGNATKVSPVGSTIQVSASMVQDGEFDGPDTSHCLKVSVHDSGGGIAPKDQGHVFERLYRVERPLINGLGETGVGLSIVKSLVEAHGGRVWVESEIGVGSTFNFQLPYSDSFDDPWMEMDVPPIDLSSDRRE